ncbi:MAG: hypothetical protein JNM17_22245 [Archangium sp.]|nr:hypothetical protein [Archangium sp.]
MCGCPAPAPIDAGVDVYDLPGRHPVGVTTFTVAREDGGRPLTVEVWYPADESARAASESGFPVEEFESDATRRAQLKTWVEQAPALCTPRRALGARDAPISGAASNFPLLLMSHCTECFRFSMHSLAERLATQGFIVAAPDHLENTRFDATASISNAFLLTRSDDLIAVTNALEGGISVGGSARITQLAVVGHSFGAVTAGKTVERDARFKAGFLIAAPVDSPFLNSGSTPRITRPLSWLLAMEDNSISYLGNDFIRDNFTRVPKPNVLVEVENAGHWTFSDIAGLGGDYLPGCGEGKRDPDGGAFTYLDNDEGRRIALRTVTAWAKFVLEGDEAAKVALSVEREGITHVKVR